MQRWEMVEEVPVPGGGDPMRLMRRGAELVIRLGDETLMSTRMHGSEDALADLAFDMLGARPGAKVLVGGLGVGFTLATALRHLGPEGRAVVAEVVPAVVTWGESILGEAAGHPTKDPRVEVYGGDVAVLLRDGAAARWDAILLDVDNSPDAMTRSDNGWLYGVAGLAKIRRTLTPGGVLAVWSAVADEAFTRRLKHVGFSVEMHRVGAQSRKRGKRHVVWTARRSAGTVGR